MVDVCSTFARCLLDRVNTLLNSGNKEPRLFSGRTQLTI